MAKTKSVWNKVDTEKEPDVYKIIKEDKLDELTIDDLDLDEGSIWDDDIWY